MGDVEKVVKKDMEKTNDNLKEIYSGLTKYTKALDKVRKITRRSHLLQITDLYFTLYRNLNPLQHLSENMIYYLRKTP